MYNAWEAEIEALLSSVPPEQQEHIQLLALLRGLRELVGGASPMTIPGLAVVSPRPGSSPRSFLSSRRGPASSSRSRESWGDTWENNKDMSDPFPFVDEPAASPSRNRGGSYQEDCDSFWENADQGECDMGEFIASDESEFRFGSSRRSRGVVRSPITRPRNLRGRPVSGRPASRSVARPDIARASRGDIEHGGHSHQESYPAANFGSAPQAPSKTASPKKRSPTKAELAAARTERIRAGGKRGL